VKLRRKMISLHVREIGGRWFGLATAGDGLVATTVGVNKRAALADLLRSLPQGVPHKLAERPCEFDATLAMLREIESGDERHKAFTLASEHVREPLASVLRVAAAIPIGYATSYGNIAKAAGTEARVVGRVMASNPLYPIVPCHRVVGADLSLVGYRRSRAASALDAKLARLRAERRGYTEQTVTHIEHRALAVFPVEWVVRRAETSGPDVSSQRTLFEPS
jgi:O-6-methylguanine DNA methyltransferase